MESSEINNSVVLEGEVFAIRLDVFDGPLELLLHLIRKEELDIFDIPISRLTTAYLAYLEALQALSIEPASEFLVMAATLTQMKSAMLLPTSVGGEADVTGDVIDPRDELVRRLLEYERYRAVSRALELHPRVGRDVFLRAAGLDRPPDPDDEDDLANQDVYRLAEAFRALVARGRFEAPHDIHVERISLAERIAQIAQLLAAESKLDFETLCAGARHREELITTFLAVLEMARLKLVRTVQGERLGVLYVEARVGAIATMGEDAAGTLDGGYVSESSGADTLDGSDDSDAEEDARSEGN